MLTDQSGGLYLGIAAHVVCIRKEGGEEQWRTELKPPNVDKYFIPDFMPPTVVVEPEGIFAYGVVVEKRAFRTNKEHGFLYALCPLSGSIRWSVEIGAGYCTVGSPLQTAAIAAAQAHVNERRERDIDMPLVP